MKRVLITGEGSYVGTSVRRYLLGFPERYSVETVDTLGDEWRRADFSRFDVVYHVAGIAHSYVGSATEEMKKQYYSVNTELAVDAAQKAKAEGVGQFIFMSSSLVYGDSSPIGRSKVITRDTPCSPANFYGDSKVKAEEGILRLADSSFKTVILRCPMIYGKGCKGNFPSLMSIAKKAPFFPKVKNERSMLYIGNLAEFVRLMIENEEAGIFWPSNRELSNTSELVRLIAACKGKKMPLIPGFSWLLKLASPFYGYINKAFGSLSYERTLGDYRDEYRLYSLEKSIEETVK